MNPENLQKKIFATLLRSEKPLTAIQIRVKLLLNLSMKEINGALVELYARQTIDKEPHESGKLTMWKITANESEDV